MNEDTVDRTVERQGRRTPTFAVLVFLLVMVAGCGDDRAADPPTTTEHHRTVQSVLDAQSAALLRGDETGFSPMST